jgi:hypothetical protein
MPYVYLLRDPNTNLIKIGRATNLETRLANLRTANPRLEKVYVFETEQAVSIERFLHKRFAIYQQEGEYFDVPIEQVIEYGTKIIAESEILFDPKLAELESVNETNPVMPSTHADWDLVNELTELDAEISELMLKKEVLLAKLRLRIDTSAGIQDLASWKLRTTLRFNQDLFRTENPDLFEKYKQATISRHLKYHRFL